MMARLQPGSRMIATLAVLLLVAPAWASHTVFRATVDRFEAVGNNFGAGMVDEFDNGTISPGWAPLLGTLGTSIVETGGVLVLQNPGVDINLVPGLTLDITNVENTTDVDNGAGDFTLTSYWPLPLPAPGVTIHFELYGIGAGVESSGLTLTNAGAGGMSISANETLILGASGTPQSYTTAVDPSSASGAIVLRLAFDDASDALTCSFSLNSGATFHSPFPPLHAFQAVPNAEVILGANTGSAPPPPPPPAPLCDGGVGVAAPAVILKRLGDPAGDEQFYVKGRLVFPPPAVFNPMDDGAQLRLEDYATSIRLLDLTGAAALPPGGPGGGCDARDGWTVRGTRYVYRNFSNALPPACTPGSARGLTLLKAKDQRGLSGAIYYSAKGKGATIPGAYAGAQLTSTFVFGGAAAGQAGLCGVVAMSCREGPPIPTRHCR